LVIEYETTIIVLSLNLTYSAEKRGGKTPLELESNDSHWEQKKTQITTMGAMGF